MSQLRPGFSFISVAQCVAQPLQDYVALARRFVALRNRRRLTAALAMFGKHATFEYEHATEIEHTSAGAAAPAPASAGAGGPLLAEGRDAIADRMHAFFARYRWDGARDAAWAVAEARRTIKRSPNTPPLSIECRCVSRLRPVFSLSPYIALLFA